MYNSAAQKLRNVGRWRLAAANDELAEASNVGNKVKGRKNRVMVGYKAMMVSYIAVGLLSAVRTGSYRASALVLTIAGYLALPAGVSYILISAAKHDRLGSDTYKRMNLAMMEYGLIGLSIIALEANNRRNATLALAFLLSAVNSIKGYAYGVLGWEKSSTETTLLKDLMKGIQDTVRGLFAIPQNLKAAGYQVATFSVATLKIVKLKEIAQFIQANSVASGVTPLLARFNRLSLLTIMLYTLKDAANRGRLGGTTFIQMNYLCALSMMVNCFHHASGPISPLGALCSAFAIFFVFNGISSSMKKKG